MIRTEINVSTGEVSEVALTQAELDEMAAWQQKPAPSVSCTPWQICKALLQFDLLDDVESAVAASNDRVLQIGWAKASEFRSDDPFVLSMGAELGKTEDETRDLIVFAATL